MDKGLKLLFATYWSNGMWGHKLPTPDDFEQAKAEGYMFDPAPSRSHDETLHDLREIIAKISPEDASKAFLYSLSTSALHYRSALGSYYYGLSIPDHIHDSNGTCYYCNWMKINNSGITGQEESGYNVLNFERYKWGGVRHTSPEYALFDLEQFILLPKAVPTYEDRSILKVTPRKAADNIFTYAALMVMSVMFLFPCLWLILASLSKTGSLYDFKGFFPAEFSFQTFIDLFTDDVNGLYPYKTWFFNTLYVAVWSSLLGSVLVLLTAYVMSRFRFKGRDTIKKTTLVLGMFPGFMGMTAVYIIMTQLGLIDKLESLIFFYAATTPVNYMVQKGYFDSIPNTIFEAARLDGATNLEVFTKITLPLSKPMVVYTMLTQFAWPWSDVLLPKLLLKDRDMWTVAVGLFNLPETHFARFAAGSVFIAIPIVILYFCLVKNIVNGLTAGAVKG